MLWVKETWKLWQLQRGLAKIRASFNKERNDALNRLTGKERRERLEYLQSGQLFEESEYIDGTDQIYTQRILRRARRLRVPNDHSPDCWQHSQWNGGRSLTPQAFHALRAAVRKEEGERRGVLEWWLKTVGATVTAATGLGGVIIGILAFLQK